MSGFVSQPECAETESSLAKSLAPEDIRVGDMVTPLHETYDYPSFFWCEESALADRAETVAIRTIARDGGRPLRVKAVCLPFVLVKCPKGKKKTLDIRRIQLARLSPTFARVAWKMHKKKRKPAEEKSTSGDK